MGNEGARKFGPAVKSQLSGGSGECALGSGGIKLALRQKVP